MLKRTVEPVVLALLALLALRLPVAFAQNPAVTVVGPSVAKGDGATPIQLQVTLGSSKPGESERIQVEVSAGRVVGKKDLSTGLVGITLLPPRVVEEVLLSTTVRIPGGHQSTSQIRLLPAIASPEIRASNGPLDLQVPARMILGHDKEATVRFRARTRSAVHLYASAGTLSTPERDTASWRTAIYTPPAEKLPRLVLIVAATDDGSIVDFAPIQLYGYPLVSTVSEPHATVFTRVAGEVYGPFQADRRGRVELRVLVPPGVTEAQTVAQDAFQNERTVALKLGVSAARESFAICPAASETFFFFSVDGQGVPRTDLKIRVGSTLGELSPPQLTEGRYYASPLALPAQATLGQSLRLTGQIEREPDSRVVCDMTVAGEAPTRLELTATPRTWFVDSGQPPRIDIHAIYRGQRTPRAVSMQGSADLGELSQIEPRGIEHATAVWHLPANFGGRREAKLQVQTVGPRPVKGELVLRFEPGAPAAATMTVTPGNLIADGRSRAQLVVHVVDAHGNPVDAVPAIAEAQGTVSRFKKVSSGVYSATYRSPQSTSLEHDDISIRVANTNAVASARIDLRPITDRMRLWGALGYTTNYAKVHGPTASAGGAFRLPHLRGYWVIGADVGFYAHEAREIDASGQEPVSIKTTVVPIIARASYELQLADFSPYLGIGAGLGFVRFDAASPSLGRVTEWRARPVLAVMLGTLWRLGPGAVLAEITYRSISLNELAVSGNVGGLSTVAGYSYDF